MSNKFFTWTKGDRKNAVEVLTAGGVIPIPVECISIKGYDVRKTPKLGMMPDFGGDDDYNKTSPTSLALHDAAVESATSLMAVVNDLLKSAPVSAHLAKGSSTLQLPHGRPRSKTAPSRECYEAHPKSPVELEGSMPSSPLSITQDSILSVLDAKGHKSLAPEAKQSQLSVPEPKVSVELQRPPALPQAGSSTPVSICSVSTPMTIARPVGHQVSRQDSIKPLLSSLRPLSMIVLTETPISQPGSAHRLTPHPKDSETALLNQISSMRTSHDEHIKSLKYAHEQEVASHISYIAFLERRQLERTSAKITTPAPPSELSAIPQTPDDKDRRAQEAVKETEALRRNLSLLRRDQAEAAGLRRQLEEMRNAIEQRDQRILQLKDETKIAKDIEQSQRNTIADLEMRLIAANNQRLDVLEGFHVACSTLEAMSKNRPSHEIAKCLSRASHRPTHTLPLYKSVSQAVDHQRSVSLETNTMYKNDVQQVRMNLLKDALLEKDSQIKDLQARLQLNTNDTQAIKALQAQVEAQQAAIARTEADRERFHHLLQAETRRSVRSIVSQPRPSSTVAAEASAKLQGMITDAKTTLSQSVDAQNHEIKSIPGLLEKELEHCISEIIMYKLDVRGYRKDLKEARAQIDRLQMQTIKRPATPPDSDASTSVRSRSSDGSAHSSVRNGLGITAAYPPITPPRPVIASDLPISPAQSMDASTPLGRPKTPFSLYKKLPEPPAVPVPVLSSTPPVVKVSRADTMRSISDSIISSYVEKTSFDVCRPDPMTHDTPSEGTKTATVQSEVPVAMI